MPPQSSKNNTSTAVPPSLFARLSPAQRARVTEIFNGWNLPPEKHEEYFMVLMRHLEAALDAYLALFKRP
jgi:hypothetical protein